MQHFPQMDAVKKNVEGTPHEQHGDIKEMISGFE